MLRKYAVGVGVMLASFVVATQAWAQAEPGPGNTHPVGVSFVSGLAVGSHRTGPALGGTLTYDFTDRAGLDGTAIYVNRGTGMTAFELSLALRLNLLTSDRTAVPYVAAGGGLYRASFDLDHVGLFGRMGEQFAPGMRLEPVPGPGAFGMMGDHRGIGGTDWGIGGAVMSTRMPAFYAGRLGAMTVPADGRWGTRSFVDPAVTVGAGVNVNLTPRLFVRPDARALIVLADGNSQTLGLFSFTFGYRF